MFTSLGSTKYAGGLAFLIFLSSISASAQSGIGVVRGWVVDQNAAVKDGKFVGIAGAKVEIGGTAVKTDKNGTYDSGELQGNENYRLKISAPGYRDYELSIFIGSEEIVQISVLMLKTRK